MTVVCPGCRRAIRIPPDKEAVPKLRARCSVCGTVFVVAEASLAMAPTVLSPPPAAQPPASPATAPPAAPTPPRAAPPAPAATPRAAAAPPSVPPPVRRGAGPRPGSWRRCATHPDRISEGVCTQCGKGWCAECVRRQGTAMICASCDALCVPTAEREAAEERARQRARPLRDDLGTIFRYPLSDKMAYVLFAVFVGVFSVAASFAAFGAGLGVLFSQGLLYAYAFTAINRVSAGNLKGFMPEIGDMADLADPLRVGLAALIVSTGPLVALTFLHPPADVLAAVAGRDTAVQLVDPAPTPTPEPTLPPEVAALLEESGEEPIEGEPESEGEGASDEEAGLADGPAVPAWVFGAFALALLWKLVYSPIALVAGAISHSFLKTLNPLVGLDAIRRMGSTYWTAMALYTGIAIGEFILGAALGLIPLAGGFARAFVQAYAYLAIGCLLGLAVFKKATELGLD